MEFKLFIGLAKGSLDKIEYYYNHFNKLAKSKRSSRDVKQQSKYAIHLMEEQIPRLAATTDQILAFPPRYYTILEGCARLDEYLSFMYDVYYHKEPSDKIASQLEDHVRILSTMLDKLVAKIEELL